MGATIMRSFQTEQFSRFLPSMYNGHVNVDVAKFLSGCFLYDCLSTLIPRNGVDREINSITREKKN